ncbi:MAG: GntR family transcriptional regulator [Afipia sp.]|nr:GntR family transcriptional regulator [Afipia sp.]
MENFESLGDSLAVVRHAPTLRIQALEKLRRAIIEGKIPAGSRLVERKLCDLLDVSRTVVREILRQLEAEGWVVNPPYKGPTVTSLSLDEARQIYEIRIALEGHAAKLAAMRATEEQVQSLERIVKALRTAADSGDVLNQIKTIEQFYEALLVGAGNTMMSVYLASQRSRLTSWRSMSLSRPERAIVSFQEKERLVAAIRDRDATRAQRIAEDHIRASAKAAFAITFDDVTPAPTPEQKSGRSAPPTARKGAKAKR